MREDWEDLLGNIKKLLDDAEQVVADAIDEAREEGKEEGEDEALGAYPLTDIAKLLRDIDDLLPDQPQQASDLIKRALLKWQMNRAGEWVNEVVKSW